MNSKSLKIIKLKGTLKEADHMVCSYWAALKPPPTDESLSFFFFFFETLLFLEIPREGNLMHSFESSKTFTIYQY